MQAYGSNTNRSLDSAQMSLVANSRTNLHAPPEYVEMPKQSILGSKRNLIEQILLMESRSSIDSQELSSKVPEEDKTSEGQLKKI